MQAAEIKSRKLAEWEPFLTSLSPLGALRQLRARHPGAARIYVAGCSGEPLAMADAFKTAPDLARDLTFLGIWVPGLNHTDWASLHETARAESIFLSPALRPGFEAGKTDFLPLSYTQAYPWLQTTPLDAAIVMVSPPDETGMVSLGVSADFSLAPLSRPNVTALALINTNMPAPLNSPRIPLSQFDLVAETDVPLVNTAPASLPPVFKAIATNVVSLLSDGDSLQFGLGNVQQAVLEALTRHRDLKIHAGMITDPLLPLLDAGAISDVSGAVTTGIAIGSRAFYARVATDPRIRFKPVAYTHDINTLAAIPNLKAINSIIEVDLFGQANAEFIEGQQVSGVGGLVDFLRGASRSNGGMPITALASTAKRGTLSRIVARLPANATSIGRADMGIVVTEHGVADLRGKSVDMRARALITIADPAFQDSLANQWDRIRSAM